MADRGTIGVQRAYAILFAYVVNAVEELGTQEAFSLLTKVVEERGKEDGRGLIRRLGIHGDDLEAGLAVYQAFLRECGVECQVVEKSKDRAVMRVGKCPIYDAYHSAITDCDWLAESMCKNMTHPLLTAIVKQVNPRLKSSIRRYRTFSNGYCLEELALE